MWTIMLLSMTTSNSWSREWVKSAMFSLNKKTLALPPPPVVHLWCREYVCLFSHSIWPANMFCYKDLFMYLLFTIPSPIDYYDFMSSRKTSLQCLKNSPGISSMPGLWLRFREFIAWLISYEVKLSLTFWLSSFCFIMISNSPESFLSRK